MNDFPRNENFEGVDELHRRLTEAVAGVSPREDALDRLRERVATRRRQRQVLVASGSAAAVVVMAVSTAVLHGGGIAHVRDSIPIGKDDSQAGSEDGDDSGSRQAADNRRWPSGPPGAPPFSHTSPGVKVTSSPGQLPSPPPPTEPAASPTSTPSPSATAIPACAPADLKKTDNQSLVNKQDGNVGYGFIEIVNDSAGMCTVNGLPAVSVLDATSGEDVGFTVAPRSGTDSPDLAEVATNGRVLALKPHDTYRFQFAWTNKAASGSDVACAGPDSSDTSKTWALRYQVGGSVVAQVSLPAACKGSIYETDIYLPGEYQESFGS